MTSLPELPPEAFAKQDPAPDALFYAQPRFVTHIDDGAIAAVTDLYRDAAAAGRAHPRPDVELGQPPARRTSPIAAVIGHGMNAAELAANPRLTRWFVQDLNARPVAADRRPRASTPS